MCSKVAFGEKQLWLLGHRLQSFILQASPKELSGEGDYVESMGTRHFSYASACISTHSQYLAYLLREVSSLHVEAQPRHDSQTLSLSYTEGLTTYGIGAARKKDSTSVSASFLVVSRSQPWSPRVQTVSLVKPPLADLEEPTSEDGGGKCCFFTKHAVHEPCIQEQIPYRHRWLLPA